MSYDKIVDSGLLDADLTSVANAIRDKSGDIGSLSFPEGFRQAISNLSKGTSEIMYIDLTDGVSTSVDYHIEDIDFIKNNCQNPGFALLMLPLFPVQYGGSGVNDSMLALYCTNYHVYSYTDSYSDVNSYYGYMFSTNSVTPRFDFPYPIYHEKTQYITSPIRVTTDGDIVLNLRSKYGMNAGLWMIIMLCVDIPDAN